jgi:hypothetical protein
VICDVAEGERNLSFLISTTKKTTPSSKAHSFRLLMEETSYGEEVRQQILKFVQDFIFTRCKKKNYINL